MEIRVSDADTGFRDVLVQFPTDSDATYIIRRSRTFFSSNDSQILRFKDTNGKTTLKRINLQNCDKSNSVPYLENAMGIISVK